MSWFILRYLVKSRFFPLLKNQVEDLIIFMFVGMLFGARLLYMAIYYVPAPNTTMEWWEPFAIWQGGLSFHGAITGMLLAAFLFARFYKVPFLSITDSVSLCGYGALFFGRIGNFINAELYGRITNVPWGMSFPVRDWYGNLLGWTEPRHPSQIYECIAEGLMCFAIVWMTKKFAKRYGIITGIGIIAYGILRFICEFFREPDEQIGYLWDKFTMGQLLCAIMVIVGICVVLYAKKTQPTFTSTTDELPLKSEKDAN